MAPPSSTARARHRIPTQLRAGYRKEVQGLRALAVLMVVTYHIWFGRVSGGVDIFLLISAFLMTLSFLKKSDAGSGPGLLKYWLHTFSRLLPAAVTVLLGTLAATWLFVPKARWAGILEQTWASIGYFQNWLLASEAVDYYANDHAGASPLQHFWSLSVQGQIFILWPLLFAAAALGAKLLRIRFRAVVLVVFGTVFTGSLAFSVWETSTSQGFAYFDTRTRLWEFALGTLLALALPYVKLPRPAAVAAGWTGLAAMLSAGFVLDVEGQFPGYVALWPLAAAALIIVAGTSGSRFGVDRILSLSPLVKLGGISYALYLWHWPVLVVFMTRTGQESVGLRAGAGIIALSLILAWATTALIERPVLRPGFMKRRRWQAAAILVSVALVAAPVAGWQGLIRMEADRVAAAEQQAAAEAKARGDLFTDEQKNNPGALSLREADLPAGDPDAPMIPATDTIGGEWGGLGDKCPDDLTPEGNHQLADSCQYLAGSPGAATILAVGNSHTQQWLGALKPMAQEYGYEVIFLSKGGCSFGIDVPGRGSDCNDFNAAALAYALELRPDAVFTVATAAQPDTNLEAPAPGLPAAAAALDAAGITMVGIRDNPRYGFDMISCITAFGADSSECTRPKAEKLAPVSPANELRELAPGLTLMDLTDQICPADTCPPVLGNVLIYMDTNHLTTSYTRTTAPVFADRFHAAAGWSG